ncbi:MAG: hypothetical protein U0002_04325 [Thermoanaerobaculia bacterium]
MSSPEVAVPAGAGSLKSLESLAGARFGTVGSSEAVLDFGDIGAEAAALAEAAGLVDLSYVDRIELSGKDCQRLLHGLVSCEVKALVPGQGAFGFFTGPQGKVLSPVRVLVLPDRLWLELAPGLGSAIAQHLAKYILTEDVAVQPLSDRLPIALLGPGAGKALAGLGELPAAAWAHRAAKLAGSEVRLVRSELLGAPGWTIWLHPGEAGELWQHLRSLPGVAPVGWLALERARARAGIPAFGQDYGSDHFPQETGLEPLAVSYTKGCYLGQEVIARIHYRGKANRAACRLRFDSLEGPPAGARLLCGGEEVGSVGSTAPGRGSEPAVGIAVLHRKGNEPGTILEIEGGGSAEVAELPPISLG